MPRRVGLILLLERAFQRRVKMAVTRVEKKNAVNFCLGGGLGPGYGIEDGIFFHIRGYKRERFEGDGQRMCTVRLSRYTDLAGCVSGIINHVH